MGLTALILGVALAAADVEGQVALTVEEPAGVARKAWPVTSGIPLAQGAVRDPAAVGLVGPDQQAIPLQTEALARWPDGSARWLLVDFQVDLAPKEKKRFELRYGASARPAHVAPLDVRREADRVRINTGPMQWEIRADAVRLPGDVWLDRNGDGRFDPDEQVTGADNPGVVLGDDQGREFSTAAPGKAAEIAVEQAGPLRACVRIAGSHQSGQGRLFRYVARVHAFRGQPFVRVFYTFINDSPDTLMARLRSAELVLKVPESGDCVLAGQPGAGGTLLQVDESHYRLAGSPAGKRAPGWAAVVGPKATVALGLREFWQNWPKGITCTPREIRLGICPPLETGLYDGKPLEEENKLYYYLRGGRYTFKVGVARTHELWATFAPGRRSSAELAQFFAAAEEPLLAVADPAHVSWTKVLGDVPPADEHKYAGYDAWLARSLAASQADRQRRREFGMLNYGDWYGERGVNWGNLEYDLAHGVMLQFLRTGDRRFFLRGEQAARHHVDVDVIHATNALLKNPWGAPPQVGEIWLHCLNHTGGYYEYPRLPVERTYHMGHSTNFGHVWVAGDLEYFYLSGDRRALEVGLLMADRMAAHCPTAYSTHIRGLGWPMILVLAAYEATGDKKYLDAATKNWEVLKKNLDPKRGWVVRLAGDHCKHGDRRCFGNVPFMEGLTCCALARYHRITGDPDVLKAISIGVDQMIRECWDADKKTFRYTACPLSATSPGLFMLSVEAMAYEIGLTGNREHLRILREGMGTALRASGPQSFGKGLAQIIHFAPYALRVFEEGLTATPAAVSPLAVRSDFEGGSARVDAIDQAGRVVRFRPAGNPKRGWPCWWFFRLTGIRPGETITLDLTADTADCQGKFDPLAWTPERAAISFDGRSWRQLDAPGQREGRHIRWTQRIDAPEAWLAWGPPFTTADATSLVERLAKNSPYATAFELCRSREGRRVPGLAVEEKAVGAAPRFGVWIEARQHAWEIGGSWACRGLMEWLAGDDPRAAALRKKCAFQFVPVMDADNAATGDGGKNQVPHDHNRDWSDQPVFHEVRAAQERIRDMVRASRMDVFIDLHDPERGARESFYFFPPRETLSPRQVRNHDRLLAASKAEITGPIRLRPKAGETGSKYDPKMWKWISKNWVIRNTPDHVVAVTLEIAWNTPDSTAEGFLAHGRQLGMALERYFRDDPRK